jgi:heme/copper-type cytochrome/quinol oxidase subunit 4
MSSRMQGFERGTLIDVLKSKRVWLIHLFTNALLMVAFFYWTRISEATGWQFALTVVFGLGIAFVALWLHCATFLYFQPESGNRFAASLRTSVTNIPAFLVWTVVFGLVLWWIGRLWTYDSQIGGWTHHALPLFLRRRVAPRSLFVTSHWLTWFLYCFLWPILFLPFGGQAAAKSFRGFFSRAALRPVRELRFWVAYLVCFVVGAYAPYTLAWMVPKKPSSLSAQTISMVVRLGIGYLLLVTAWVVLCAAIMRAGDGEQEAKMEREPAPILAQPSPSS